MSTEISGTCMQCGQALTVEFRRHDLPETDVHHSILRTSRTCDCKLSTRQFAEIFKQAQQKLAPSTQISLGL